MLKYRGTSVLCICGHPEWAHYRSDGTRSASGTWFEGEVGRCLWDYEGKPCKCKHWKTDFEEFKKRPPERK